MSLTIRVYLHSFSSCCFPDLRNSLKIQTPSSSRSSFLVPIESGICNFLLAINSNFERRPSLSPTVFWDIDALSSKITCFPIPPLFDAPSGGTQRNLCPIERWKVHWATSPWQYDNHSFSCWLVGSQICEIRWNSERIRTYTTLTSSILVSIESA